MFTCSNEIIFNLAWKHKAQRICRFLLHDLSNHLTGSLALSELYCEHPNADSLKDGIVSIRNNCYKERDLLMRLSQLNHASSHQITYIDLKAFLAELLPIVRSFLPPRTNLTIEAEQAHTRVIQFSPERLQRIFLQILFNSAEALQQVSDPEICIKCILKEELMVCEISDNGCGIPLDVIDKILEAPKSLKLSDETHLGMGLAMVQFYISAMQGKVEIASQENGGTTVLLYFRTLS